MWHGKDLFFLTWYLKRQKCKNMVKCCFINFDNYNNLPPKSQSFNTL